MVIRPETKGFRAETEAQVKRDLSGFDPKIDIGADIKGIDPALAQMQAKLRTFSKGRVAFADLIDYNLPQSQIIGQLILLKRLVQRSGISDLIAADLNTSQIEEQLQKISDLNATISVEADTSDAVTAVAGLQARLQALGSRLSALRINADTGDAEANIAKLQARLEKIRDQIAKILVVADTTQLDKALAKEEAALATLQRKASDLQIDADTAKAAAKLAGLEKQASDLYDKLDKLEADVDVNAALTKIYAIEAELAVLRDNAKAVEVRAQTAQFDSAIAASEAKVAALKQQAQDVRLGATFDTAGLRAAEAAMLGLSGDVDKATNSFAGAAVSLAKLDDAGNKTAKVPIMTAGWWGGGILGIKFWHLALDAALESTIAVAGAAIALGAGIAAISEPAYDVGVRLQGVRTVSSALGVDIPPLTGKFDALMKSMVPQTVELFGAGLRIVNSQAGNLHAVFEPVVSLFDTWAAKIVLWVGNQHKFSQAVQGGLGYLTQFGSAIGHLVDAIDNFLNKDPGIAHYFADLIVGFAGVLDLVSKLPGPLLAAALGLHAVYLWTKVLAVAPVLAMARGLGLLNDAQVASAKSALSFKNIVKFLLTNPFGWAVDAAAAIGFLAYQLTQASSQAHAFIGNLESGLGLLSGSDAIFGISQAVGQLNQQIGRVPDQLNHVQDAANKASTSAGKAFEQAAGAFTKGNLVKATEDWAKTLFDVGKAAVDAGTGVVHFAQTKNDVSAYRAEIAKLGNDQSNLLKVMGHFTGQGQSVAGSLALMTLAGVKYNDSVQVGIEKVDNLITGYKNVTGTGGALESSVNAVTFATLQQQEKVSDLNNSWDTFFKTVTGGASGFLDFAKQTIGLYQSMGSSAATLRTSNGKVSISLAGVAQAAGNTAVSMHGLNIASINAQQTFLQSADAANAQMDNLNLLANAAGLGQRGVGLLTRANKDMVASLLPAAQGSKILTDVLYALAQRGGYQGANSFKALSEWAGKTKSPLTDLQGITTTLTTKAAGLTQDVKNLSLALGTTLNNAMAGVIFTFDKGQKALSDFAVSLQKGYTNSKQQQSAALELASTLVKLTGNTTDAHREFDTFSAQLGLTKGEADKLWSEITGKLTPAVDNQANKSLPAVKSAFRTWAEAGLDYTKGKADDLWNEINAKLGPKMDALGNLASGPAKQKFIDWAVNGLHLTQNHAHDLWAELVTLQNKINSMHGTSFTIQAIAQGKGGVSVTASGLAAKEIAISNRAFGGLIDMGSGPTADDVHAMLSKGEFVHRAKAVQKYGVPAMEAVNEGRATIAYASGGLVGLASDISALPGPVQGAYASDATTIVADDLKAEIQAMIAAIKAQAAKAASIGGITSGALGGDEATNRNLARSLFPWPASMWPAYVDLEMREAGFNRFARNPSSGAYGIPQALPPTKMPFAAQAAGGSHAGPQIQWMYGYIRSVYGNPLVADAHEQSQHWYKYGGLATAMADGGLVGGMFRQNLASGGLVGAMPGYASGGLAGAESAEKSAYSKLVAAYRADLKNAKKGSWTYGHKAGITSELGTLGRRQAAEVAAYNAVTGKHGSLSHFATTVREETATSHDIDLSHSHPSLSKVLWSDLATLLRLINAPGSSSGGSGGGGKPHDPGKKVLISAQEQAYHWYAVLAREIRADLAHAKKGDYTSAHRKTLNDELATLTKRMDAELVAYARMAGSGFKAADWPKLASAAKAEMSTASDQALNHQHPGTAASLRKYLAEIADVKPPKVPAPTGGGTSGSGGKPGPAVSYAQFLAKLKTDQSHEVFDYKGLEAAFAAGLKGAKKGSWLYANRKGLGERLYAVAVKQKAEQAAYDAILAHSSGSVADISSQAGLISALHDKATAEAGSLQPALLGHLPGGHPGWLKGLTYWLDQIASLATSASVKGQPWNPGNLGPVHTVGGGVLEFDTGRGVLPPGLSLTYNGTGRPEALSSHGARFGGGGGGDVHLHLTVQGPVGSQAELEKWYVATANKLARTGRLTQAVKVANR